MSLTKFRVYSFLRSVFVSLLLIAFFHVQSFAMGLDSLGLNKNARKPNIIFIMADDLGSKELGCYGNTFNETPNLDKMASASTLFKQAYAAAPVCSPTRASIMTGLYPARLKITDFLPEGTKTARFLDPSKYLTLNKALSALGYHTGIIGKWHLDTHFKDPKGSPSAHGFDEVIGSETSYIADGDYIFPYSKISSFRDAAQNDEYLTDRQNEEACEFIIRNRDVPFFLYLSYYSVHTRLDAPNRTLQKYKIKFDQKYGDGKADQVFDIDARHEVDHPDNPYLGAMLEHIDRGIGMLLATLKELRLDENTIVVFTSDNGGAVNVANNGVLRANKTWLYEGGVRVPLLVHWPNHFTVGEVKTPVSSIDFYPTFTEIAGSKSKYNFDGVSLYPLLTGNDNLQRKSLFWHYPSETGKWFKRMASSVREGDYKLIEFYHEHRLELYNLKNDPSESHNLVLKKPKKAKHLYSKLEDWKKEVQAELPDGAMLK